MQVHKYIICFSRYRNYVYYIVLLSSEQKLFYKVGTYVLHSYFGKLCEGVKVLVFRNLNMNY